LSTGVRPTPSAYGLAFKTLSRADEVSPLAASDLCALAWSAQIVGVGDFTSAMERAHHAYLSEGDPRAAVRCAFWLGLVHGSRGDLGARRDHRLGALRQPPGARVTALGIRCVPDDRRGGHHVRASPRQVLWGVRLPRALPAIMLAVDEVILMVVAMVVIAGLTGGGALGYLIVDTFARVAIGRGVEVAVALTLIGMILDRLTQALAERMQPPPAA
jgi:hypothetical protein